MSNQHVRARTPTGLVLNIQHFCTHDGPGIRTTVFLKAARSGASGAQTPKASSEA